MDRDKTKKSLKEAMKKLGSAPKRKVSGMSPGKRKAITGSATGKTTREKLMAAFKKVDAEKMYGGVMTKKKMMGAAPMAGSAVGAMSKAVTGLARQISGKKGKPTSADISKARSFLKQAMTAAGKGK